MITHKHLRSVIEDIYLNDNELTQDLLLMLIHEFRYSNLYIPAKKQDNTLNFIIYEDSDGKITPLFTDLDEFHKFYRSSDVQALSNSFEVYRNIIKKGDIEGYVLNPASEKYLFSKDFILGIENIPRTNFFSTNPYSEAELRQIYESLDNKGLEDFIENRANVGDYEGLFEKLTRSRLLTLMLSDYDLSSRAQEGLVSQKTTGPVASMYIDSVGGKYATIFSSAKKLRNPQTSRYRYAQLIDLATLVNFVLSEDMDGIILNPQSDNVLIPRATLLRYSLGFEKFSNDERLFESIYYLFLI